MTDHNPHLSSPISHLSEAQDYQLVGELAPEAEQVLTHQKGWDGIAGNPPAPEQPIAQAQAHDLSFWNRRANRQVLGDTDVPPAAGYELGQGYTQTPTAATSPQPFDTFDDGIISGASAAAERSGNQGVL